MLLETWKLFLVGQWQIYKEGPEGLMATYFGAEIDTAE